jgi:hypothetical protein
MVIKIIEKPELGSFISPHKDQQIAIHNWFAFKHSYSRELTVKLINHFGLKEKDWVLDPFCGGGTTLLTCKELGINARGYDILPFSVFLSNVKTRDYDKEYLRLQLEVFKNVKAQDINASMALPEIPLVEKAFNPEVREALIALKSRIEQIRNAKTRDYFNLAFLSIVESVSNTSKTGGFLRIIKRNGIDSATPEKLFLTKADLMIQSLDKVRHFQNDGKISVLAQLADARELPTKRKFDAVITSPPYPNRHDYTRIYSLEMIFDFIASNDELKAIRYETIRSHVEARKKYEAFYYRKSKVLEDVIKKIRFSEINNPQIISMIEGYFEDMYLTLAEISRCLKRGGKVCMVVSNVRFAGVSVPVDEILSEAGEQTGLMGEDIWALRYRGNSSQQMKTYTRNPSRESIVFWSKK